MDGFPHQQQRILSEDEAHQLQRTINHLCELADIAAQRGDQLRADELRRVVKSYRAQLVTG